MVKFSGEGGSNPVAFLRDFRNLMAARGIDTDDPVNSAICATHFARQMQRPSVAADWAERNEDMPFQELLADFRRTFMTHRYAASLRTLMEVPQGQEGHLGYLQRRCLNIKQYEQCFGSIGGELAKVDLLAKGASGDLERCLRTAAAKEEYKRGIDGLYDRVVARV
jgi:hypothetical protein